MRSKGEFGIVSCLGQSGRRAPRLSARYLRFIYLGITAAILLIAQPVQAQFTGNIKTNTINGVNSNWVGNISYIVGSNTFKDVLQITNSGVLSNRLGILGYETSASNNVAIVNNGVWRNQDPALGNLYVGYNGSGNRLIVTNGGQVFCHIGELGIFASSSNNVAVVTGTGSVWSNEVSVAIGQNGAGNQLIVTNGGTVVDATGYLGVSV
jgi:T5SS/PEP-CTERM-associated repeat protein